MKPAPFLCILLVLAAWPAVGQATEPATDLLLMEDPSGDQVVSMDGQPIPLDGRYRNMDLRSASITETEDAFTFTVTVDSMDDDLPLLEWGTVNLAFAHNGQEYRIQFRPLISFTANEGQGDVEVPYAFLLRHDPTEDAFVEVLARDAVTDGASMSIDVPRMALLDPQGSPPFPGRVLSGFEAWSEGQEGLIYLSQGEPTVRRPTVDDRMPDDGPSPIEVPVFHGIQQEGHVRLSSPEPMRASNGEATVFYYELEARSLGPADRYTPVARDLPAGWEVRFNTDSVAVNESGTTQFLAEVTIPFAHKHGSQETILVELPSQTDPATVGRAEIGVHYVAVPQPTGHHDTLYVHSTTYESFYGMDLNGPTSGRGEPIGIGYINTLDVDERDDGSAIFSQAPLFSVDDGNAEWEWDLFLSPGLRMGLDFDLDDTGEWEFGFKTLKPLPAAVVSGTLYLWPAGAEETYFRDVEDAIVLGTFDASDAQEIGVNGRGTFSGIFTPAESGDYIAYERGQRLMARVVLEAETPAISTGIDNVLMEPGGRFRLPLLEYADTIADASGFTLPDALVEEAEEAFEPETEEAKDTPAPAAGLALLAVALARRRR